MQRHPFKSQTPTHGKPPQPLDEFSETEANRFIDRDDRIPTITELSESPRLSPTLRPSPPRQSPRLSFTHPAKRNVRASKARIALNAVLGLVTMMLLVLTVKRYQLHRSLSPVPSSLSQPAPLFPSALDARVLVESNVAQLLLESHNDSAMIPDIVHYVVGSTHSSHDSGQSLDTAPVFGLQHWLSIKSARDALGASEIYCHVVNEPSGEWWQRARPLCTRTITAPNIRTVYGRPVYHRQHKDDIVRLQALLQYGGIAAELDTLFTKSFKPDPEYYGLMFRLPLLLGHTHCEAIKWDDRFETSIIAARPNNHFIAEWLAAFKQFREEYSVEEKKEGNQLIRVYTPALTMSVDRNQPQNKYGARLVWDLHTLRPHMTTTLKASAWGAPYAAEARGLSVLYDANQPLTEWIAVEAQYATHLWQIEHEVIVEKFDADGKLVAIESRYEHELYDKFLLRNTEDVCVKSASTIYARLARLVLEREVDGKQVHQCKQ